jgi:tRNA(adenine34) deaminase
LPEKCINIINLTNELLNRIDSKMEIDYIFLMEIALEEAKKAWTEGEVPVGAVLVDQRGEILARDHNRCIGLNDPTAHAEILAIREAAKIKKNYRLDNTTLVVTIEPCPMCAGAAVNARIKKLVFGAFDPKAGAAGSVYDIAFGKKLNHNIEVVSGILSEKCASLIKKFFEMKRKGEVPKWS